MRGVITERDIVVNLGLIWREFGAACMLRCVVAAVTRRPTTFLDLALRAPQPRAESPN